MVLGRAHEWKGSILGIFQSFLDEYAITRYQQVKHSDRRLMHALLDEAIDLANKRKEV